MSVEKNILDRVHSELITELERLGVQNEALRKDLVRARLGAVIRRLAGELKASDYQEIEDRIFARLLGAGPLEPLLGDPAVTEIMANGPDQVFVERHGVLEKTDIHFGSEAELLQLINRVVGRVGRRIDTASPLVDARLPDGSRVHAVIPPLSLIGPVLTIRRLSPDVFTLLKLEETKSLSKPMVAFLQAVICARHNVLISGGAGAGKTSMLVALSGAVPETERLITIEDVHEIRLTHPHLVSLEARQPNMEGKGEITIRTLLKNALRMRPDRIIIGEIRSGEALDMLQAMNTGHRGSLSTVHANAPLEALYRVETMALMAEVALPLHAIRAQIRSALQYLVHLERHSDGVRRVVSIAELPTVHDSATDSYKLRTLFVYDREERRFRATGEHPERAQDFIDQGISLDQTWFSDVLTV